MLGDQYYVEHTEDAMVVVMLVKWCGFVSGYFISA
jgi:hypothetical protein